MNEGPLAAAHRGRRRGRQLAQLEHVAVVDLVHRHAVGRYPIAQPVVAQRRVIGVWMA